MSLLADCERSVWQVMMMPVGRWRSCAVDEVLLTF